MEVFGGVRQVRLRSSHKKYLVAKDDERRVTQHRDGSLLRAHWTVEIITNIDNEYRLRFRSCYGCYLAASFTKWSFLSLSSRNVIQEFYDPSSIRCDWLAIREGSHLLLRSFFRDFLRANPRIPPWRSSVTLDTPSHRYTQNWFMWDVEILEWADHPPPSPASPILVIGSSAAADPSAAASSTMVGGQSETIQYNVADDVGNVDENIGWRTLSFAGITNISNLKRKLQEETGFDNIYVCTRDPLDHRLVPLPVPLPSNYTEMQLVVVKADSTGEFDLFLRACGRAAI